MVFGSHVDLHSLKGLRSILVNEVSSPISSHKRDGLNVWVVADLLRGFEGALDYINDTGGELDLIEQLDKQADCRRSSLAGLDDVGVAAGNSNWEHPERNHGREIERADSSANAQRHSVAVAVDTRGEVPNSFPHHNMADPTSLLDDLQPSEDITFRVRQRLPMLLSDNLGDFILMRSHLGLVFEHVPLPSKKRHLRP